MKTLKPNILEEDKIKFLQEAAIMGQFLHPNVVKLHGVVTVGEPVSVGGGGSVGGRGVCECGRRREGRGEHVGGGGNVVGRTCWRWW